MRIKKIKIASQFLLSILAGPVLRSVPAMAQGCTQGSISLDKGW